MYFSLSRPGDLRSLTPDRRSVFQKWLSVRWLEPQGLKPTAFPALFGTTEVVP
jgi:hypothetical protein